MVSVNNGPLKVKMRRIISNASDMLAALKKIHAKQANTNVVKIWKAWYHPDDSFIPSRLFHFFRGFAINLPSTRYSPLMPPQAINVQFAPCQKPLIRNTRNRLKKRRGTATRLPPRGIYK